MCEPAGPFYRLGPAWADHETSWDVLQEDVPEDETDVLYQLTTPSEATPSAPEDSSPQSLGLQGRDPLGQRACEWTSDWAGLTRS